MTPEDLQAAKDKLYALADTVSETLLEAGPAPLSREMLNATPIPLGEPAITMALALVNTTEIQALIPAIIAATVPTPSICQTDTQALPALFFAALGGLAVGAAMAWDFEEVTEADADDFLLSKEKARMDIEDEERGGES